MTKVKEAVIVRRGKFQAEQGGGLDQYLGSEGLFGVITELTLSLQPLPHELWGIVFFFEDQPRTVDFLQAIDQRKIKEIIFFRCVPCFAQIYEGCAHER